MDHAKIPKKETKNDHGKTVTVQTMCARVAPSRIAGKANFTYAFMCQTTNYYATVRQRNSRRSIKNISQQTQTQTQTLLQRLVRQPHKYNTKGLT